MFTYVSRSVDPTLAGLTVTSFNRLHRYQGAFANESGELPPQFGLLSGGVIVEGELASYWRPLGGVTAACRETITGTLLSTVPWMYLVVRRVAPFVVTFP